MIKPNYYNDTKITPFDVIDDWDLNFNLGSCMKYIKRAGKKDGNSKEQDLEKAITYLSRELGQAEQRDNLVESLKEHIKNLEDDAEEMEKLSCKLSDNLEKIEKITLKLQTLMTEIITNDREEVIQLMGNRLLLGPPISVSSQICDLLDQIITLTQDTKN